MINVFQPYYDAREEQAILDVIRSQWVMLGPRTDLFEKRFAEYYKTKYAVAFNSCTAALYTAMKLQGIGPGDSVLVPTITFAASAMAVVMCGATPVFTEVEPDTLLMDWEDAMMRKSVMPSVKMAMPVMYGGQIREYPNTLPLVYDCAHSVGSEFPASGKTCCWSFNNVKNLAGADGGMITTDDEGLAKEARNFRLFGIDKPAHKRDNELPWTYSIPHCGEKLNMNDLTAALCLTQLDKLEEMQARRKAVVDVYYSRLMGYCPLPNQPGSNWHLFVIRHYRRNDLHRHLMEKQIRTMVHYPCVHLFECFRDEQMCLPVSEQVADEILTIPAHANMHPQMAHHVCDCIESFK